MKLTQLHEDNELTVGEYLEKKRKHPKGLINSTWRGDLSVDNEPITSLEGCPRIINGNFFCNNRHLSSLDGCPEVISESFGFCGNELTSLQDVHKQVKEIGKIFFLYDTKIKSHVLGLLYIKKLQDVHLVDTTKSASTFSGREVELARVHQIINRYLKEERSHANLLKCKFALIDLGLDEYAKL